MCIEAIEEAVARCGKSGTSLQIKATNLPAPRATGLVKESGIAISMDGKAVWRDKMIVERLWRDGKYREVYLLARASVAKPCGTWPVSEFL